MHRLHYSLFLPLLILLTACAANPNRTAQTVEQDADVYYGRYVIAKEQGAKLLQDVSIPDGAKRRLAEAMVASKAPADSFQDALIQYSTVKAQLAAGMTSEEKLLIAQQNMDRWLAEAKPVIDELIQAVGGLLK